MGKGQIGVPPNEVGKGCYKKTCLLVQSVLLIHLKRWYSGLYQGYSEPHYLRWVKNKSEPYQNEIGRTIYYDRNSPSPTRWGGYHYHFDVVDSLGEVQDQLIALEVSEKLQPDNACLPYIMLLILGACISCRARNSSDEGRIFDKWYKLYFST